MNKLNPRSIGIGMMPELKMTSHQWAEDLAVVGEIIDPDGWRAMDLDWNTPVVFDTFHQAWRGHNTRRFKRDITVTGQGSDRHVVSYTIDGPGSGIPAVIADAPRAEDACVLL